MRKGIFAIYQGVEYEAGVISPNVFSLHSYSSADVLKGFSLHKGKVYVKNVQRSELDEVYKISTYAIYQGYKFGVYKEEGEKLLLFTGDYSIYKELNLEMVDRGVYEKWVNKSDITSVFEGRHPL